MKKLLSLCMMTALLATMAGCQDDTPKDTMEEERSQNQKMQIVVQGEQDQMMTFQLNDSSAAKSLYDQLPLTLEVEDYSTNEKICYPPEKLDVSDTPMAKGVTGTLAYYEPWGDVVMLYGDLGEASGLFALGEAISHVDQISELSGTIQIRKAIDIQETEEDDTMHSIQITIGEQKFSASLYDNETVQALLERLPMTVSMEELHGNEKYYYFSEGLPTDSQNVSQIHTGDIKLFGSDCLVLFYQDFSTSYSYTSLGQIDDPQGLAQALGSGNVQVHFDKVE